MIRIAVTTLLLLVLVACGGGPKRIGKGTDSYLINNTLVDPARKSATFSISVHRQSTQSDVKTVAEQVIDRYKAEYPNITVKTYLMGSDLSDLPYATTMFADNAVTHLFNQQPASQKIPTH